MLYIMKRSYIILGLMLIALPAMSQSRYRAHLHNVDAFVGTGFHQVEFKPQEGGDKNGRLGYTVGANYRLAYYKTLAFSAGLNLTSFSAKSEYDYLEQKSTYTDPENGEVCEFGTEFHNWNEIQKSINLELPVGAYYTYSLGPQWGLVGGGGLMLDIPVSKKFKSKNKGSDSEMKVVKSFDVTNVEYEDLPQHGMENKSKVSGKAEMKGAGLSLFIEGGAIRPIDNDHVLYMGIYFSQSVTNSLKDCDNDLFTPSDDPDKKGKYSGIVSSNLVAKTHIMAVGVKVGFSFGVGLKTAGGMSSSRKY